MYGIYVVVSASQVDTSSKLVGGFGLKLLASLCSPVIRGLVDQDLPAFTAPSNGNHIIFSLSVQFAAIHKNVYLKGLATASWSRLESQPVTRPQLPRAAIMMPLGSSSRMNSVTSRPVSSHIPHVSSYSLH